MLFCEQTNFSVSPPVLFAELEVNRNKAREARLPLNWEPAALPPHLPPALLLSLSDVCLELQTKEVRSFRGLLFWFQLRLICSAGDETSDYFCIHHRYKDSA